MARNSNDIGNSDDVNREDNDDDARMTTKRQRMQQLIQKSMRMEPRSFEHEVPMLAAIPATSSLPCNHPIANQYTADSTSIVTNVAITTSENATTETANTQPPAHNTTTRNRHSNWTPADDAKLRALVRKLGKTQWALVASHFTNHDRKRCRERFVNHVDPQLARSQRAWTADEDAQLRSLQHDLTRRWAAIARAMPGRSAEDVKNRSTALVARDAAVSDNASSLVATPPQRSRAAPNRWTSTEADTLRALVATHGASNWLFIASQLPGRTDLQCMQQWHQVLDPAIVKGKGSWTAHEDATLTQQVQALGTKWTQIAQSLPGRVGKQCRERYLNHLDPSINKDPWTSEDDATLVTACRTYATHWSQIAATFPKNRTENALKNRWHALVRRDALRQQQPDDPSVEAANVQTPASS